MDKQIKSKDYLTPLGAKLTLTPITMRVSALGVAMFVVVMTLLVLGAALGDGKIADGWLIAYTVVMLLIAFSFLYGLQVARQWEKAVVLRLGKFKGLHGPGVFMLLPLLDAVSSWIDHRVMVTPFSAEKTLTSDTVPVDVDAVLFWVVWDAEKAALEVAGLSICHRLGGSDRAARGDWPEGVGGNPDRAGENGRGTAKIIDERTTPWGITVQSVEIRDVIIPQDLEDAMSRQAQAERERQARVILGESEMQIAHSFAEASICLSK